MNKKDILTKIVDDCNEYRGFGMTNKGRKCCFNNKCLYQKPALKGETVMEDRIDDIPMSPFEVEIKNTCQIYELLKEELKKSDYKFIGQMGLSDEPFNIYNCETCKTTIAERHLVTHYLEHYNKDPKWNYLNDKVNK